MEAYATALLYVIPFFIVLVIIEIVYGRFINKYTYRTMDTISSLSSGLTNIVKDALGIGLVIISYPYLLETLSIIEIQVSWLVYLTAFVVMDFANYWNHRLSHKINFFWNQHIIHHSSEEFNLACALRQSVSNLLGYFPILLLPAAIVGIPHQVIAFLAPIHLFAQFWYHTKHIGKLGILEYIIVTPSQHRVHHAINEIYIDKNLGAIFCLWDRWFGTFQEELDEVVPVYGVLKPVNTWNPILINFQHLWRLIQDAYRTNNWLDKFRIWFMPTGWRPEDVKLKFPVKIIEDPYHFAKYESYPSKKLKYWSIFQIVIITILILFMFFNIGNIQINDLLLYGLIIFVGIYGYTSLMDKSKYALIPTIIYASIGIYVLETSDDWFGINSYLNYGSYLIWMYLILTLLGSIYFSMIERSSN